MPGDRDAECVYVLVDVAGSRRLGAEGTLRLAEALRSAERHVSERLGDALLLPPRVSLGDSIVAVLRPEAGEAGAREVLAAVREALPGFGLHAGAARGVLWFRGGWPAEALGGPALWAAEDAAGKSYPHGLKWPGWERESPCEVLVAEP